MRSFRERYAALNPESPRPVQRTFDGVPVEALELGLVRRNAVGEIFVGETRHNDPRLTALSSRQVLLSRLYFNQPATSAIRAPSQNRRRGRRAGQGGAAAVATGWFMRSGSIGSGAHDRARTMSPA